MITKNVNGNMVVFNDTIINKNVLIMTIEDPVIGCHDDVIYYRSTYIHILNCKTTGTKEIYTGPYIIYDNRERPLSFYMLEQALYYIDGMWENS